MCMGSKLIAQWLAKKIQLFKFMSTELSVWSWIYIKNRVGIVSEWSVGLKSTLMTSLAPKIQFKILCLRMAKLTMGCCGCSFMVWAVDDGICWMFVCCCCCCCWGAVIWVAIRLDCCWFADCWTVAVFGDGWGTVGAGAGLADACWFDCLVLGETTPPKFKALRPR